MAEAQAKADEDAKKLRETEMAELEERLDRERREREALMKQQQEEAERLRKEREELERLKLLREAEELAN